MPAKGSGKQPDLDEVCRLLLGAKTQREVAQELGMSPASLSEWISADSERSARVHDARRKAAVYWDEKAQQGIEDAGDPFELAKAKELAHHFRWRASKIAPQSYGEKQQVEHSGSVSVQIVSEFPDG